VRRASHARDGRRVDVLLTARGRALSEASFAALLEAQSGLLAPFGGRKRGELLSALDALLEVFAGVRPPRAMREIAPMRGTRAAAGRQGRA
jgi:DNA-binding MarR family transcriptional regulator